MANVIELTFRGVDETRNVIDGVAGGLNRLGDIAKTVVAVGFAAAAAGATALAGGLAFSIAQAIEGEKILTRLDSVIRSTGGAAGLTTEAAQDLATQFMDLAGGTDDTVLAIQEMALRMGNITASQMPDFIQTTLDLAAATGTDAVNAARLLAQTYEDPVSALTRWRRMGIQFSEDLETQIKEMVKSGDAAGANALIMERLAEATEGAAAAAAGTLAGQWEIMRGRLGEAAESIGTAFLPILHELFENVIKPAIPFVEDMAAAIGAFVSILTEGDLQAAIEVFGEFESFQAIFKALGVDIYGLGSAFEDMVEAGKVKFGEFMVAIQPIITAAQGLAQAFIDSMPMIQAKVKEMVDFVLAQAAFLAPTLIANVTEMLEQIATFWRNHGDEIMAIVAVAWQFIVVTVGGFLTLLSGMIAAGLALINGDTETAHATMKNSWEVFLNSLLSIVDTNLAEVQASWSGTLELLRIINFTLWSQIVVIISAKLNEILAALATFVVRVAAAFLSVPWESIGRDIVNGIAGGITGAIGGLVAAAINAALSAYNAAKAALGISSPSKLFAGIGANMMAGMAQGISGNVGMPAEAMRGAAAHVSSATNNYGGNTYNYYGVEAEVEYAYQRASAGAM